MKRWIKLKYSDHKSLHDDENGEVEIRRTMPKFFNVRFGRRETFSFYRGFVICRHTVQFTGCRPERRTVLYIYLPALEGGPNTLHVDLPSDTCCVATAKHVADRILAAKSLRLPG